MSYQGPEPLDSGHVLGDFDCGDAALNEWLGRRALGNQRSGASRTWVVLGESRTVVAYYSSATTSIVRVGATRQAARNQPPDVPGLLLARMAVDRRHQGRGLGAALLKHFLLKALEVAQLVGVRVVLVHAKNDDARRFYLHHDFHPSPIDDLTLMRVLGDLA